MSIFKGMGDFFALDIGTKALRVVQLSSAGNDQWKLEKIGYLQVDPKITAGSSETASRKLGDAIVQVVNSAGISAKTCVVGLSSLKTFTTVIDMPKMTRQELESTLKYQADKYIPMPLNNVRYDWDILGDSPINPKNIEVLLASVPQEYVERLVEIVDSVGYDVIATEPDSMALIRCLIKQNTQGSYVLIDMGENATDLVVTMGDNPRLVRTLQTGFSSLVRGVAQSINIKEDQASQFLLKFGIDQTRLDGSVYNASSIQLDAFISDIDKSIKFYQNKYANKKIDGILVTGYGAKIPKFIDYIKNKSGLNVQITSPWQKVNVPQNQMQKILSVESEFATAVGLAQRTEK